MPRKKIIKRKNIIKAFGKKLGRPRRVVKSPASSFLLLSDEEKETVGKAVRRAGFGEEESERLLNSQIAYYEQDNFTVALLKVGEKVRVGVSKRNPTKEKILQVQDSKGRWVDFLSPSISSQEFAQATSTKVVEKVVDKPNPQVGRTVALARAVRAKGLIL